ncbi:hypothetical protein ABLT31_34245 [Ammoniphilus sp. 3BR4]
MNVRNPDWKQLGPVEEMARPDKKSDKVELAFKMYERNEYSIEQI